MSKIELPRRAKPSKALGTDLVRPALTRAYVVEPNGHRELIASDSYIMVRIPVAADVPLGNISTEALKRIEKGETHELHEDGVDFLTKDGSTVKYPTDRSHSMFEKSAPEFDESSSAITIAINPKLLASLAEALGPANAGVKLEIALREDGQPGNRAMRVTPLNAKGDEPKPTGLIMPLLLRSEA